MIRETQEEMETRKWRDFLRRTEPQRRRNFWDRKERDYLDGLKWKGAGT